MTVVRVTGDGTAPIRLKLAASPAAMRMRLGGVEAMRLRFQSGIPGAPGVPGEDGANGADGADGAPGAPGYNTYLDAREFNVAGDGATDDTAELQALLNAEDPTYTPGVAEPFRRTGVTCFIPQGTYLITSPLVLPAGVSLVLDHSATIIAGAAMSALIMTPEATSVDQHNNSFIVGGIWDCNDLADNAIWLKYFAKFTLADLQTHNALDQHIWLGSATAPASSYEAFIRNVLCRRDLTAYPNDCSGIRFQNCGDSHVSDTVIMGVEYGITGTVYDSKFDRVHVWNATEHGNLGIGFAAAGSDNIYTECQVDAPIASGGSGWYFTGARNSVIGCGLNYFGGDNNMQALFLGAGAHTAVIGCTFKGASGSERIGTDVNGDVSGSVIIGNHLSNVVSSAVSSASGFTAFTGTTNKATAYATGSVTLVQLAERVAALQAALRARGIIGS